MRGLAPPQNSPDKNPSLLSLYERERLLVSPFVKGD
jgi:hypothetical protein